MGRGRRRPASFPRGCLPDGARSSGFLSTSTMATFAFPFPTTGSITFTDFLTDPSNRHTLHLADATAARANVRGVLKTDRRTSDGEGGALAVLNVSTSSQSTICCGG